MGTHPGSFSEENIADGRPGRKPTPTRCVLEVVLRIHHEVRLVQLLRSLLNEVNLGREEVAIL